MYTKRFQNQWRSWGLRGVTWAALAGLCATSAVGAPPLQPIPAPLYSFDLSSPQVQANFFDARDVLMLDHPQPLVAIPGAQLGLASPVDELNAFSGPGDSLPSGQSFVILFSVDRATLGTTPPDPLLASMGLPYNVLDQASRGQAAGDQFMSLDTFVLPEGLSLRGARATTALLTRNNYDEGGTDFESAPATSAGGSAGAAPQDNTNATGAPPTAAFRGRTRPINVYFSLTRNSPSLLPLSGSQPPSGANLFFNADPIGGAQTDLYAAAEQLSLSQLDDIDAVIIFDRNTNGLFDGADMVLFSLTPNSPSLATIPGASSSGAAADVFIVTPENPPLLFAPAGEFGMGMSTDNIDALDFEPCNDAFNCAIRFGIRVWGDMNCDGVVDLFDIDAFVLALTSATHTPQFDDYYDMFPFCQPLAADTNQDGSVNNFDIDSFVALITGV